MVEIPEEYDSNLVEECCEYNLHTSKTSNVEIISEVSKPVSKEKFVRGWSIVNPKSKNVKC